MSERCLHNEVCKYGEKRSNGMYCTEEKCKQFKNATTYVEVVRCKDCKYWRDSWVAQDGKHEHGYCYMEECDDVTVGRWGDDFCSYGERKDNG